MKVELKDIRKYFGPVRANDGISVTFEAGAIHGLLGENGAGKSTLMKVLSGFLIPDGGQVFLQEEPIRFSSPAEAIRHGVGMLHQDPLDFPPLRVLDNFLLGRDGGLFQGRTQAKRQLLDLSAQFDFQLDPEAEVSGLTVGERQQLEILRLLSLGVQVLILDEPTTGISASQKDKLFATLRRLAEQGKAIIFVSHKLEEVQDLCAQVTVLRRGRVAGEVRMPCSTDRLVQLMFGQVFTPGLRESTVLGETVLELEGVSVDDQRLRLAGLSLQVRAGEVIGLAGLEGSGQRLFLRACAGLVKPLAGRIRVAGADMTRQAYRQFREAGVAYLPAGRLEEGLIPGLNLAEHFVLASGNSRAIIDWAWAHDAAAKQIKDFHIQGRPTTSVEDLSGGNQQRMLLALLSPSLRVLLLEHPTRGLDVESTLWIWDRLLERRQQGTAILFTSSDLDEILERSDRILVFSGGHVTRALNAAETTVAQLGELIGGKGV